MQEINLGKVMPEIMQSTGVAQDKVMSQKAVTDEFKKLFTKVIDGKGASCGKGLFDIGDRSGVCYVSVYEKDTDKYCIAVIIKLGAGKQPKVNVMASETLGVDCSASGDITVTGATSTDNLRMIVHIRQFAE